MARSRNLSRVQTYLPQHLRTLGTITESHSFGVRLYHSACWDSGVRRTAAHGLHDRRRRHSICNKIGGMDRQTLRDWAHRFNAAGPPGASSTIGRRVPSLACRRSNGPGLRRSSRPGWIVKRTASCGGGGSISSASSLRGSASTFTRAMSESSEEARLFRHEQSGRISAPSPYHGPASHSIGGGLATLGSEWRIKIKRISGNGQTYEVPASLDDQVEAGDTIIVSERIF